MKKLVESSPECDFDVSRVIVFDEIAFMSGKWEGVKNRPLASAISMSNLACQIVKSPIIIGGEYCYNKAEGRGNVKFVQDPIPSCFGLNDSLKDMIKTINNSDYSPKEMRKPSEEAIKAARDVGMEVIGVNLSAYFTAESFLWSLDLLGKAHHASPFDPIIVIGDNARVHITPAVGYVLHILSIQGYLFGFPQKWSHYCSGTAIYFSYAPGLWITSYKRNHA